MANNPSPNFAIPNIPAPVADPRSLPFVVLALKQAVDSLAGRLKRRMTKP